MEKNFVARIMANINNFQRNVRKAQREAQTKFPKEILVKISADLNKLERKLKKAKGILTTIPPKKEIDIDANIKKAELNFKRVTSELYRIPPSKQIDVEAKTTEAQSKIKRIIETLRRLPRQKKVTIEGNDTPIKRAIQNVKASLTRIKKHVVEIDGDTSPLMKAVATAKAKLAKWREHTVKIKFKRDNLNNMGEMMKRMFRSIGPIMDDFTDRIGAMANRIRSFGTVFGQTFLGIIVATIQAVIPMIAGLVPALMAVANALGVVAGGALGLAGAFSIGFAGVAGFAVMAASAIKMLGDGTLQATAETQRYQEALDKVQDTWEDIIKQNQSQIFNTLANALNTVSVALERLTPFIHGVSEGMERASQSVLKWAQNSKVAQRFFDMMNTTGVKTFNTLLNAAGRFGDGLINVFTQLAPLFLWTAKGLENLGRKFQQWANSVAGQNAIRGFIDYTKENLPKVGQIFGNTFAGIGNLMKAFAENSANIFDWLVKITAKFREWSQTVSKSQGFKNFVDYVQKNGPVIMELIGNIVRALVAFGTAMAPIASVLLRVITAMAGFIAKLFETHPAVARFLGLGIMLGGMMWSLMVPFTLIQSILSRFGLSLISLIGEFISFASGSKIVEKALNVLKTVFSFLMNPISKLGGLLNLLKDAFMAVGGAIASISGPVWIIIGVIAALVAIITYLWNTNESFRNFITNCWNKLKDAIGSAVESIKGWLQQLGDNIQQTLQPIMPILQMLGQLFNQVLGVIVMGAINGLITGFQALWTIVSIVFQNLGMMIQVFVQTVVALFTILVQLLTGDWAGAWQTFKDLVSQNLEVMWNWIQGIWNSIVGFLNDCMTRIFSIFDLNWSQMASKIGGYCSRIWNSVSSWFSNVVSTVGSKMSSALSRIISTGSAWVSSIVSAMTRFVSSVVRGFVQVVSSVGNGMHNAVNKVRNFIESFVSAGYDMMMGLVRGIQRGAKAVVDAATSAARRALNAAKHFLGIASPSREFMAVGQFTMQGFAIGIKQHEGKAVSMVKEAARNVQKAFNPSLESDLLSGINSDFNSNVDSHMTQDVKHSMQENNRPIVNITVRNEGDVELIKSRIDEIDAKDANFDLM
ncbi:terminase [uncultured Staphylococcus sp.]|uniref:phage tail protein n=1 Tax=uncultured Staphylococcus sp. TaxID=189668 RepID=UPI0025E65B76|nr:terminase [uncultured Staphylococcus sp.]